MNKLMNHLTDIGVLLDELFCSFQLLSLWFKLQCNAFVANCSTELLAAFIWDRVVPQIHRFQRPVDVRNMPFHEAKSGHKLVSIDRMQMKNISNRT